jgi:hypothetical protein
MEQYCITLEQAKRLKELGFKKDSLYGWANEGADGPGRKDEWFVTNYDPVIDYQAYTVGELGEILPDHITTDEGVYYLGTAKYEDAGWAMIYKTDDDSCLTRADGDTEAEARGNLLIYLLESKLI